MPAGGKQLTLETVDELAADLKAAPALERKQRTATKQEAVTLLRVQIRELVEARGYTYSQVAELLNRRGVAMSGRALRVCLDRAQKGTQSTPPRQRKGNKKAAPTLHDGTPGAGQRAGRATPAAARETEPPLKATGGAGTFVPREDTRDI